MQHQNRTETVHEELAKLLELTRGYAVLRNYLSTIPIDHQGLFQTPRCTISPAAFCWPWRTSFALR